MTVRDKWNQGDSDKVRGPASYFPSIEQKYGKPITEWKALIRANAGMRHKELVDWLKAEHGMGHGHASALVAHTFDEDARAQQGNAS